MSNIDNHRYDQSWNDSYFYEGLVIHAGRGIHETVFASLQSSNKKTAKILVLGSGTGAFDKRLYEHDFKDITSVDINHQNYQYDNQNIKFVCTNLNDDFANAINEKFDVIVAIEVIEHIYSTDSFLKNCRELMHEKSQLLISTPNPRSYSSRWKYLLKGYHAGFEGIPQLYEHVNPIHIDIFRHFCHFNEMEIKSLSTFDHQWGGQSKIRKAISKAMGLVLSAVDRLLNKSLVKESKSILFLTVQLKR